jgi:Icc-related predicted phosphoesterase
MTRILAFSDLHHSRARAHAIVAASAEADLVIGAGDFCNHRTDLAGAMGLLAGLGAPMVAVPGNAESAEELREAAHPGTTVLHGEGAEVLGLRVFGLGYAVPVTPFGAWSCDLDEPAAEAMLSRCEGADILVSHSPPKGAADRTSAGTSIGSTALRAAAERIAPRLLLCGHVHDSWGASGRIGETEVRNLGPAPSWFEGWR